MRLNTPVTFIVFNRPDKAARVFAQIRKAQPKVLFIVSDAPRSTDEAILVSQSRAIAESIDWPCSVYKNYATCNLGCKERIVSGLNWVFSQVDRTIILEDDCVPTQSFFEFCDKMLDLYYNDEKVMHIAGSNFIGESGSYNDVYYLSREVNIWGWATWKRAWDLYDKDIQRLPEMSARKLFREKAMTKWYADYTEDKAKDLYRQFGDNWDLQWLMCIWENDGVAVVPYKNQITNIGIDSTATHKSFLNNSEGAISYEISWGGAVNRHEIVPDDNNDFIEEKTKRVGIYKMPYFLFRLLRKGYNFIRWRI